jgi:hypothetical protein
MTYDMADHLLRDLRTHTEALENLEHPIPSGAQGAKQVFTH